MLNSSSAVIDLKAPISTTPLHSMHLSPGPKHGITWQLSNLLLPHCSSAGIAWTFPVFGASRTWKASGAGAARASSNCTINGDNVIGGDHGGNVSRFGRRCNQASSLALVWTKAKQHRNKCWVIKACVLNSFCVCYWIEQIIRQARQHRKQQSICHTATWSLDRQSQRKTDWTITNWYRQPDALSNGTKPPTKRCRPTVYTFLNTGTKHEMWSLLNFNAFLSSLPFLAKRNFIPLLVPPSKIRN